MTFGSRRQLCANKFPLWVIATEFQKYLSRYIFFLLFVDSTISTQTDKWKILIKIRKFRGACFVCQCTQVEYKFVYY